MDGNKSIGNWLVMKFGENYILVTVECVFCVGGRRKEYPVCRLILKNASWY